MKQVASPRSPARPRVGRTGALTLGLGALLVLTVLLAVGLGGVTVPPGETLSAILGGLTGRELSGNEVIVWQLRLPRVVLGLLVGASLGVCGAAFQGVFRNPLADP
ncbi:iron chelate uptake ABC transporter family permease subunit, partial [Deinococcus pimensis]|uniref:iron chelate uptake ABC transporter family permease subunit n=1 Tax=Deinococcus pimensis TaxID=309888 RepID=UPI0005EB380B